MVFNHLYLFFLCSVSYIHPGPGPHSANLPCFRKMKYVFFCINKRHMSTAAQRPTQDASNVSTRPKWNVTMIIAKIGEPQIRSSWPSLAWRPFRRTRKMLRNPENRSEKKWKHRKQNIVTLELPQLVSGYQARTMYFVHHHRGSPHALSKWERNGVFFKHRNPSVFLTGVGGAAMPMY